MKIELGPDQPLRELESFLDALNKHLEEDEKLEEVSLEAKNNHKNWNSIAKPVIGKILRLSAKEACGTEEGVWIEGEGGRVLGSF